MAVQEPGATYLNGPASPLGPFFPDTPSPVGKTIRGDFGAADSANILPGEGDKIVVDIASGKYGWKGVLDWTLGRLGDLNGEQGLSSQELFNQNIANAVQAIVEAESGFHNLAWDWIRSLAEDVDAQIDADAQIFAIAFALISALWQSAINTEARLEALETARVNDNAGLEWLIAAMGQHVATQLETWSYDNILGPAYAYTSAQVRNVNDRIDLEHIYAEHYADDKVDKSSASLKVGIGNALGLGQDALGWIDGVGNPLDESVGPKTDVGKALDALKGLLGLLAGVSLAGLTLDDIESIARLFQTIGTGDATAFVDTFVAGGASIGSAGASIFGDLEHIAAEAFAKVSGL